MSDSQEKNSHQGKHGDMAGEHAFTDVGQLVLALLFAGSWIADVFFLKSTVFANNHLPLAVRVPVGAVLLVLAAYMAWTSHRIIFGSAKRESHVLRTGVFAVVRHPMYLSEILLYLGFLFLSVSLLAGGVWLVGIGFFHFIAREEERLLLARFGDEYSSYMRDVGMWLPRVRRL